MADWYVYHSAETMGGRYGQPEQPHVFSTVARKKLGLNSRIWVIEGVGQSPKEFYLAAQFVYEQPEYPPFPAPFRVGKYTDFVEMYTGTGDSYGSRYRITSKDHPWFDVLYKGYITKQKFFNEITPLADVVEGLTELVRS